ncbi:hypothetical protein QFZ22_007055 [Streptomyces canus]|uniref:Uncharacterized protein n=1 Tax=Streptomyces canus TaxID=58343 RepID=A0AAW8FP28_9ACTN|nr:hypothetical protein [Streptomyces canus]MDQ0911070.1 hypothetical protein [Streptomyces canus]
MVIGPTPPAAGVKEHPGRFAGNPPDCALAGEADVPYASHLCAVTSVLEVNEATASMITAG